MACKLIRRLLAFLASLTVFAEFFLGVFMQYKGGGPSGEDVVDDFAEVDFEAFVAGDFHGVVVEAELVEEVAWMSVT